MSIEQSNAFEYQPSYEQQEQLGKVAEVLRALSQMKVSFGVLGGYGLDALMGRLTRDHKDLDIAILDTNLDVITETLEQIGYDLVEVKSTGVCVFRSDDSGFTVECGSIEQVRQMGLGDIDVQDVVMASIGDVVVPTFSLHTFKQLDTIQNERFSGEDPHQIHKNELYKQLEEH